MPENKNIHIVAFDVPFPADYGGAIDVFYRIKALKALGFNITLHVFEYGRGKQSELEKYAKVIYYKRKKSLLQLFSMRPFIVQSRKNKYLLAQLLQDDAPILLEGLHCCYYLEHPSLAKRCTMVRMHNIEHEYYGGLQHQHSALKKAFFWLEKIKLKRYLSILQKARYVLAIKSSDQSFFQEFHSNVFVLPASIPPFNTVQQTTKRFALFHGNLSVVENETAAIWLMNTLDSLLEPDFNLIIAGKNPSKKLQQICQQKGVELHSNPSEQALNELIQQAHIHTLYSTMNSGIKLKLLACLGSSGHVLMNEALTTGTALDSFCQLANDEKSYKMHFIGLKNKVVRVETFQARQKVLNEQFSTLENCRLIEELVVKDVNGITELQ